GPGDPEWERDLGIALTVLLEFQPPSAGLSEEALKRLEDATARHPSDDEAWEGLAYVRVTRGEWLDGLAAAERALALDPGRERTLGLAAVASVRLWRPAEAEAYARRAGAANPGNPGPRLLLADALPTAERFA